MQLGIEIRQKHLLFLILSQEVFLFEFAFYGPVQSIPFFIIKHVNIFSWATLGQRWGWVDLPA